MGEMNKKRCAWCNSNSDHLKKLSWAKDLPRLLNHELGIQDFFANAPLTGAGMPTRGRMKNSYYSEETASLALVGLLGVCVLAAFVVLGLLMWGVV